MHSVLPARRLSAALLLVLASCGDDSASDAARNPAPDGNGAPSVSIDQLRAMGYADFTDAQVEPGEKTVTTFDPERSQKGYTLFPTRPQTLAQLVDPLGNIVHEWDEEPAGHWHYVELMENGDLLAPGSFLVERGKPREHFLIRVAWGGGIVWKKPINAHHTVEVTPSGLIATMAFRLRDLPEVDAEYPVRDDLITLVSLDGEVVEEHSLYDMLSAAPELFTFQPVKKNNDEQIDLFHTNSIEFMPHEHLAQRDPLYAKDNVLVSMRHQDTVAIIDWKAKKLLWAWGQGEIVGQHDATLLENGNILLFDNNLGRKGSRVIELNPLTLEIVWQYKADKPKDFYTSTMGSCQRLANGNTLIANSGQGEAFEVTPEGEVVWRFLNPNFGPAGYRATIMGIRRYPTQLIDRLEGR